MVAYAIIKLLEYSIRDDICKIPMDCSKFYVICDVTHFCLQAEVNASNIHSNRLKCCLCKNNGNDVTILELSHTLCLWWFSLLLVDLCLVGIHLFSFRWWLIVAGYYYYHCFSNNQQWPCTKVEEAGSLPLGWSTGRDKGLFRHNIYICVYIVSEVRKCHTCHSMHGSTYHYHYCW